MNNGLIRSAFFTSLFHAAEGTKLVVKGSNRMAMTEFIPPHENVGWIIFIPVMVVIATGIIQLYMAFRRKRTEVPPPPLPPPVEEPGTSTTRLQLPDSIFVFPEGRVYHINKSCQDGGKEYSRCKLCNRKHQAVMAVLAENAAQSSTD